ncbi:MAG: DUF169 domain-containing protein [Proteobacteria bacterium]|nr:DUF169 domain-containing protein [Pseudomonadota bacterium]MBU4470609.1 DUF169 domain-containing protein [Pseudomonadota bacterium]MCG2753334.1 DUF169 domain-containing protein [Desulfobacteraceae bacterium]
MSPFHELYKRLTQAMDVPDLVIPVAGVKLFHAGEEIPDDIRIYAPDGITVTSCQAIRSATMEDAVYLTKENIGCVAAAISLGLVDEHQPDPLEGEREYTEIMRKSSGKEEEFVPPAPADFTEGMVYACKDSGHKEFSLFGEEDSGRYATLEIARKAISHMRSIQPPDVLGVFYFSPDFDEVDITPDIVVLSLRPVELCRVVQGYQYLTGERVKADIGGVRAGCADLIVEPYMTGEINCSPYCLGARLIAKFEADRMGMGMPFSVFETMVKGMEASMTGFPFPNYPGAIP